MQIIAKKKKRGFTLIELLVVIAIIGILASIVLVSLSGAKNRAKDARIISDMGQIRTLGEIFYGTGNTYTGLDAYADENTLQADIVAQTGTYNMLINANGADFCATSSLVTGGFWCVDNILKSEKDANGTLVNCVATCVALNTCKCD